MTINNNGLNLELLQQLLEKLRKEGKENLSPQELSEEYNRFCELYDRFKDMSEEAARHGIDISHLWITYVYSEETIQELTNSIERAMNEELLKETNKKLKEKLDSLREYTYENNLSRQIYQDFETEYDTIMKSTTDAHKTKIEKMNKLLEKIDRRYHDAKNIKIARDKINRQIKDITVLFHEKGMALSMYNSGDTMMALKDKLNSILRNSQLNQILSQLSEFSTYLDCFNKRLQQLSKFYKYQNNLIYQSLNPHAKNVYYTICGTTITINRQDKTCNFKYSNKMVPLLQKCKNTQFIRLLIENLKSQPIETIIKPAVVNERTLLNFMKNNTIPLNDILKFNPNILISHLGITSKLKQATQIEEIFELSDNEEFKDLYSFINSLEQDGFKIELLNDEKVSLFDHIVDIYKNLELSSEEINQTISEVIKLNYPVDLYIHSSLQSVYNCIRSIDINLINSMHYEITNNIPLSSATNLQRVVSIMLAHSRNKEGHPYTEDMILNFLKNKNMAINSDYGFETFQPSDNSYYDPLQEDNPENGYEETPATSDINEILYKLTGRRH